ncbi:MAG: hypothetical protein NC301_09030 [Bacteroides sp.]|nr:hypothetical protein [Alistipes timonensis]MCM1311145.1 hypothetical protein [Bacteroides sp.]MCM1406257.1 hypothetical protein [[Clostridium] fimetarium]
MNTLNPEELDAVQRTIQSLIELKALNLGYNPEDIAPIYDGVCDARKYLSSPTKVMWILKEPYDDFNEDGTSAGGGWEVYEQWKNDAKVAEVTNVRSWQPIMYVLRALNEDKDWDDIAWIRDEREKYVEALQGCAYINVNKMPAGKSSKDLTDAFAKWEDIINAQILAYAPDVIIFGNTFQYFAGQSYIENKETLAGVPGMTDVYKTRIGGKETLLIHAYHPNQKTISRQEYVDSILLAIRGNLTK